MSTGLWLLYHFWTRLFWHPDECDLHIEEEWPQWGLVRVVKEIWEMMSGQEEEDGKGYVIRWERSLWVEVILRGGELEKTFGPQRYTNHCPCEFTVARSSWPRRHHALILGYSWLAECKEAMILFCIFQKNYISVKHFNVFQFGFSDDWFLVHPLSAHTGISVKLRWLHYHFKSPCCTFEFNLILILLYVYWGKTLIAGLLLLHCYVIVLQGTETVQSQFNNDASIWPTHANKTIIKNSCSWCLHWVRFSSLS